MNYRSLAAAALAVATLTLTACTVTATPNNSANDQSDSGDKLRVVTTTTQLTDFAGQIGGDEIALTGLLAAGASAHRFDPSPADLLALSNADVLIYNGAGLDEFVENAIEASGFSGTTINASDGIDLELAREITLEALDGSHTGHDHGDADDHDHNDGDDHGHGDADAHDANNANNDENGNEHHDGHDHDHGDTNPHLWTSPRFAQGMVEEVGRGLADADPSHAAAFGERTKALVHDLQVLDSWIAPQFERVPAEQRVLVTGHDSLRYYLHDYGIAFAGALLPSFEDHAEPSATEIDQLIAAIRDSGVRAIFVESSLSPKLAQTVAKQAGVTVIDEEALYADSLGAAGSDAETYIAATVHNTRIILEAWGETTDPLPAELDGL